LDRPGQFIENNSNDAPDLSGLRVLIVDDEPDSLEVLTVILNLYGAQVRTAENSAAALKTFLEWPPDVLLSDIGMPQEDGFSLIGKVRALGPEQGGTIPAAALTAYVREEDRVQALAAGFQKHISKPVDPVSLAKMVAELAAQAKRN
jgi:CheY-like chemotaxis protein